MRGEHWMMTRTGSEAPTVVGARLPPIPDLAIRQARVEPMNKYYLGTRTDHNGACQHEPQGSCDGEPTWHVSLVDPYDLDSMLMMTTCDRHYAAAKGAAGGYFSQQHVFDQSVCPQSDAVWDGPANRCRLP